MVACQVQWKARAARSNRRTADPGAVGQVEERSASDGFCVTALFEAQISQHAGDAFLKTDPRHQSVGALQGGISAAEEDAFGPGRAPHHARVPADLPTDGFGQFDEGRRSTGGKIEAGAVGKQFFVCQMKSMQSEIWMKSRRWRPEPQT